MKTWVVFFLLVSPTSAFAVGYNTPPCEEQEKALRDSHDETIRCLKKSTQGYRSNKEAKPDATDSAICAKELARSSACKVKLIECLMKQP